MSHSSLKYIKFILIIASASLFSTINLLTDPMELTVEINACKQRLLYRSIKIQKWKSSDFDLKVMPKINFELRTLSQFSNELQSFEKFTSLKTLLT